jgi:hypothetical protein
VRPLAPGAAKTSAAACTRSRGARLSTNANITIIVLTEASRMPDRCGRCPNSSPIRRRSPVYASAETIASADSSTNTTMQRELRG